MSDRSEAYPAEPGSALSPGDPAHPAVRHVRTLGPVPLLQPLAYPGRWVTAPTLLDGELLHPLDAAYPVADGRVPVLAVGSNGAPAQLSHKLARTAGISRTVPMEPVRVAGLGVGVSGHVTRVGYVAASPYLAPGITSDLLVTWLDPEQLALVDSTEVPNYRRVFLPAEDVPVTRADGTPLTGGGVHAYVNARGLLGRPDRTLRPVTGQLALLTALLAESAALRALCAADPTPRGWLRLAGESADFAAQASDIFRREGWVVPREEFRRFAACA